MMFECKDSLIFSFHPNLWQEKFGFLMKTAL